MSWMKDIIPSEDLSILLEAQATIYPDFISVYVPNNDNIVLKRLPGFERKASRAAIPKMEPDSEVIENEKISSETNDERSVRRTRKMITNYILCNDFELFVTFTFKENRQDIEKCKKKMYNWLKNQTKRNGKFRYLIVPELHKDKESLHFHAVMGAYTGNLEEAINPKSGKLLKQKGKQIYVMSGYTLGFNNVKKIDKDDNSASKVATYIKKYITKDMLMISGQNRYWVSKGLKQPKVIDNPEKWYSVVTPDWSDKNDNGKIMRFKSHGHPLVEKFWESYK